MRGRERLHPWVLGLAALAVALILAGPVWGQQAGSVADSKGGPVVRTFGAEGGYRTEVTSETRGKLSEEDHRQVSLLAAQVLQHIDSARGAIDSDDPGRARHEVDKAGDAMKAIRALLPRTSVRTRTQAPDGRVIYEDRREVQPDRVPLFEGMLHTETLAPILEARRDAVEVKGVRLLESEAISTEAQVDLGVIESRLHRAAAALGAGKPADADRALAQAQVQGVNFRYSKEDTPLAEARDALWLARRSLEENNPEQARFNLDVARQRLRIYQEVAPRERKTDLERMLKEADELEGQLRREAAQSPATDAERSRQGKTVTRWWDQINAWFRKHF